MTRRLALMSFALVPTPSLLASLNCDWDWDIPMYGGTGDPATAETQWPYCPGKKLVDAGIKHIVGRYDCLNSAASHTNAMLYLRNQCVLSLNHPEIYGIYINDYYWGMQSGQRTIAQVNEAIQVIKAINPSLKIAVAWLPAMVGAPDADPYLSQIQFDEVVCQVRIGQADLTLDKVDAYMRATESKFSGKSIWGTLNFAREDRTMMTDAEIKGVADINRHHYDEGRIVGMRVQNLEELLSNPNYVPYIKQFYVDVPTPISPLMSLAWLTSGLAPVLTVGGVIIVQELKRAGVMP